MTVKNAAFEDMKQLGHVMAVSFRSAFSGFISQKTLDACAREEGCIALLEGIFREGSIHFLTGENKGFLAWQRTSEGGEIVAIHSLPESWGTGLGHALITEGLNQIGETRVFLWAFEENTRARRFYEKHGFRWDGTRRVSDFDGALEVRYVRDLQENAK